MFSRQQASVRKSPLFRIAGQEQPLQQTPLLLTSILTARPKYWRKKSNLPASRVHRFSMPATLLLSRLGRIHLHSSHCKQMRRYLACAMPSTQQRLGLPPASPRTEPVTTWCWSQILPAQRTPLRSRPTTAWHRLLTIQPALYQVRYRRSKRRAMPLSPPPAATRSRFLNWRKHRRLPQPVFHQPQLLAQAFWRSRPVLALPL